MKRSITILLLMLVFVGAFQSAAVAKTEISIWYSLGAEYSAPLERMIEEFNALNADIQVTGVYGGSYSATLEKLLAAVVAGNPPVLSQIEQSMAGQFIDNGGVVSFQPFIDADPDFDLNDYITELLPKVDGDIYALPLNPSTLLLYYNKDLFRQAGLDPEKPPTTWDEVHEYAKKISALGSDINGFRFYDGDWTTEAIIWQFGGEVISEDGRTVLFNQPEAVTALQKIVDMVNDGSAMWAGGREGSDADLAGRVGMVFRSSGSVEYMKANTAWEVGVARQPVAVRPATPVGGANVYMFANATQAEKEAAWEFIKYITESDNQKSWAIATGYMTARHSALESSEMQSILAEDPRRNVTYTQLEYARPRPSFGHYVEINDLLREAFATAVLGRATAQEALDTAARTAQEVIEDYYW